ncbi:uncharacterized protein LOC123316796 [Coccinella septempunctata]|uniref:uncharacterized protein LOC123316796 n=1 Tax=Coccinella septempunctata TaxID=41139 RepID=UPI001D0821D7|nr:uncharacterized protein LOC123316796 [Coccinella septempunctata]
MIALIVIIGTIFIYYFIIKPRNYWNVRNVPTGKITPILGEHYLNMLGKDCSTEFVERIYNRVPNGRYSGIYLFQIPALVLKSPELIKDICVKNSNNVLNRQALTPDCTDPLMSKNLLALKGQLWKDFRRLLSPSFTSSKMRAIHLLLCANAQKTVDFFLRKGEEKLKVEVKDAFTRFSNDAIANAIYGLEVNSFTDENNDFYLMGKKSSDFSDPWKIFVILMFNLSSKIAGYLNINLYGQNTRKFFVNLVDETIKLREAKNIERQDVLGILMESRKKSKKSEKEDEQFERKSLLAGDEKLPEKYLTDEEIAANLFLFLLGGYDTSSTTMCFMAYELAINPEIQMRLIEEIDRNRPENGVPSYETISNMAYLDMVVSETLRKWPSIAHTDRKVTTSFTIEPESPNEKPLLMEEGSRIIIPIYGLHRDPKYYKNPDIFDPERFSPSNRKNINPYAYLPFGVGPRNCIGLRLALLKVKVLFFYLLSHFEIVPTEETEIPLKLKRTVVTLTAEKGFPLEFKRRNFGDKYADADLKAKSIPKFLDRVQIFVMKWMYICIFQMFWLYPIACILIYFLIIKPYTYWPSRNVPSKMSMPIVGEGIHLIFGKENMSDTIKRMYNKISDVRFLGILQFMQPILVVKSPELIKQICVKDFDHFLNHKVLLPDGVEDLLSKNLLMLKDQEWKNMRSTLSPSFTASKMKAMFTLISNNAKTFAEYFVKMNKNIVEVEFKDAFTRYTNDVIASTAFGLEVDSLTDRENDFYVLGRELSDFSTSWKKFVFFFFQISPTIARFLRLELFGQKTKNFFLGIVRDTIKMREEQNIRRSDMLGLLLDAKKGLSREKTAVQETKEAGFAAVTEHLEAKEIKQDLTDTDIASQVFIFFFGGFETVSTAMCFMAHELATNPDVQSKLIAEIDENIQKHGAATYESIANMTYLDMVVCETLRKWPVNIATDRAVTKPYTISPENPEEKPVHLEVGDVALIPIIAIHYDPKYYENPEKFDPERFSPENRKNINPYTYLPFGVGPRNCIGSRFALLELKAVFFHILSHFEIVPVKKTDIPIRLSKSNITLSSENGYHLGLKRR